MKRYIRWGQLALVTLILLISINFVGQAVSQDETGADPDANDAQTLALARLGEQSELPVTVLFQYGAPVFLSGQFPIPDGSPADPVARALDFLEHNRDLYGMPNPRAQLYLNRQVSDELGEHLFFGQRDGEIPVFASEIAVHLNKDFVFATNGSYLPVTPVLPPPAITASKAEELALQAIGDPDARRIGIPKLVFYNNSLFINPEDVEGGEVDTTTYQAWQLTIVGVEQIGSIYFINAQTGALLNRQPLAMPHNANKDFVIRSANNTGPGWLCGYPGAIWWFDENGTLAGASPAPDTEGSNAFNFTHQTYDYFFNAFHRHSFTGNEHTVWVNLDDGTIPGNALYENWCDYFSFGNNMSVLDILAHEFTHGVTEHSSNLVYQNQSGALNESYSDIFAAMIDGNWTIGEGSALGIIRDMSQPGRFGDPDHIAASISGDALGLRTLSPGTNPDCATNDCGFVHTNSGIPNKAAFLITDGGTHGGIAVAGIGRAKAQQVFFMTLTAFLTSNSDFVTAANSSLTVANMFALSGAHGFTAADVCSVRNGYAAVGLIAGDIDCDGTFDVGDLDDDGDSVPDTNDNCPVTANPGQADMDGDGIGNNCDNDNDNDGVLDLLDNCRFRANSDQKDSDGDTIGDACEDLDADGIFDPVDNCIYNHNPLQTDTDHDGIGDACDPDHDNDGINTNVDNCPIVANGNQSDSDGDGIGNACDSCPVNYDTPFDTDHDGINNSCDPDDDNDTIADAVDNCPTVANPSQQDINQNGIGTACDPDESIRLDTIHVIEGVMIFRQEYFEQFRTDLIFCENLDCFEWIPNGYGVEVHVKLEVDLPVQIVDDRGFVVARGQGGLEQTLRFFPETETFYRPPGGLNPPRALEGDVVSSEVEPYQGRRYFLEIYPVEDIKFDQPYGVQIESSSFTEDFAPDLPR